MNTDTPDDRCDWSGLRRLECSHCHPEARPARPRVKSPERERLRREARQRVQAAFMRVVYPVAHQAATPANEVPTARELDLDRESLQDADLHDIVVALTEPTRHRQPYTVRNEAGVYVTLRWETSSPSLLDQLGSAAAQSRAAEEGARPGYGSRPAARLDAIDALQRIESGAEAWVRRLGLEVPLVAGPYGTARLDVAAAIRRSAANASGRDRAELVRAVRSWWILARVVTGWDAPAWRPRNSCPLCAVVGELRIRLDAELAVCLSCGGEWDHASIGLLAEHIRGENAEDEDDPEGVA